jgi:hypothetical protein
MSRSTRLADDEFSGLVLVQGTEAHLGNVRLRHRQVGHAFVRCVDKAAELRGLSSSIEAACAHHNVGGRVPL